MASLERTPPRRRREPGGGGDERSDRVDRHRSRDDDDDYVDDFGSKREHRREKRHRDRRRHRRSRSSSSSSEELTLGMSKWKLGMVVGVIVVCFAMLYPKMFHPMMMNLLGMSAPKGDTDKPFAPGPIHPAMSGRARDNHMHPSMRMAAAQAGHGVEKGGGGGKGMWSWMLPCYTVGVIVFLLYTLSKIMFKPGRDKRSRKYDMRYNSTRERFEVDGPHYSDEESDSDDDGVRVGGSKMGKRQLTGLQKRLRHTESAMTKILEQLEQVSHATDPSVAEAAKKMTMDTLNQLSQVEASSSRGDRSRGRKDETISENTDQYLDDLERALREFKSLSEAYAETASEQRKGQQEGAEGRRNKNKAVESQSQSEDESSSASEEEEEVREEKGKGKGNSEEAADSEDDAHPLEPMESEDLDNLTVPEGEGEIIDLNANPSSAIASSVRKRH